MNEQNILLDKDIKLYTREVERHCDFALIAYKNIKDTLIAINNNISMDDFKTKMDLVWYSIHSLLISVGDLSKLFWPSKGSKKRGLILKTMFETKDDSPLNSRALRNHFEHYDERLDKGISSKDRVFIDSNIGDINTMFGNRKPKELSRHYDPTTETIYFKGDTFEIKPIIKEVNRLRSLSNKYNP